MEQVKIGKFIAACRKNKNMTQKQLADILAISDKTVSKWECGNGMPEVDLMKPLCDCLEITVNELLSGEKVSEEEYQKNAESNIITLLKEQEYKENYKPLIGWFVSFAIMIIFFAFKLETNTSPQLSRLMIAISMIFIDVLFTLIYRGEYVYWIVFGPKYEIAKNVHSDIRKQYAWKYLKRFLIASVLVMIYLGVSIYYSLPANYDSLICLVIIVITALSTIRIKF